MRLHARIDLEHHVAEGIQQRLILGTAVLDFRHLPFQPSGEFDALGDVAHHADGRRRLARATRRPAIAAFHVPDRAIGPLHAQIDLAHRVVRRPQVSAGGGSGALEILASRKSAKRLPTTAAAGSSSRSMAAALANVKTPLESSA